MSWYYKITDVSLQHKHNWLTNIAKRLRKALDANDMELLKQIMAEYHSSSN